MSWDIQSKLYIPNSWVKVDGACSPVATNMIILQFHACKNAHAHNYNYTHTVHTLVYHHAQNTPHLHACASHWGE